MRRIYDIYIDRKDSQFQGHRIRLGCTPWFSRGLNKTEEARYWSYHYNAKLHGQPLGAWDFNVNRNDTSILRFHLTRPGDIFDKVGLTLAQGNNIAGFAPPVRVDDRLTVMTMKNAAAGAYPYELNFAGPNGPNAGLRGSGGGGVILNGDHPD